MTARFLTAAVKGGPNKWAIRAASAVSKSLSTFYNVCDLKRSYKKAFTSLKSISCWL